MLSSVEAEVAMYTESHGSADATPILFLHGSMVGGWMWMGQVEGLADHRCILVDFPGIGRSGEEAWNGFSDTADQIAEVIRSQAGTAHVVGLSLGGIVGLYLAAQHPESIRSLLVSGVPYGKIGGPLKLVNRTMLWLYQRQWGAGLVARAFGIPDDESRAAFLETAATTNPDALRDIAALNTEGHRPIPDGLAEVSVPTLAVAGSKDSRLALDAVRYLQSLMPNAEGRTVPGVGHQWNAEEPELFTDMVQSWVDDRRIDERLLPTQPPI